MTWRRLADIEAACPFKQARIAAKALVAHFAGVLAGWNFVE
jgi:hypothetical protein